jgi:hypothetical protein
MAGLAGNCQFLRYRGNNPERLKIIGGGKIKEF